MLTAKKKSPQLRILEAFSQLVSQARCIVAKRLCLFLLSSENRKGFFAIILCVMLHALFVSKILRKSYGTFFCHYYVCSRLSPPLFLKMRTLETPQPLLYQTVDNFANLHKNFKNKRKKAPTKKQMPFSMSRTRSALTRRLVRDVN